MILIILCKQLDGYVASEDMEGLKVFYKDLLKDCQSVNNLASLNPNTINNPSIFSILASKYHKADSENITINLEVFLDLNQLKITTYEFTRILGILLDNSIEAARECDKKIINVVFRMDAKNHRQLVIIENTYSNKDVDTSKIFEKAYTTKKHNTGLGLWEVNKILNKHTNLSLFTTKNDEFFTQQLEIYIN
ncbi:MAG TPA: GHKL domain-containing protein [Candidatus Merdicola faecigallinarum]|uniref:GHKL domain-containing protein n=1 Tax=Candidatus Merdicola faecigallinarum TaxID=2840862 RepID=A0A9D1M037_9FIRM|nr:GHKL domain-containing protein [Candidatus Merdicola faecigallinarum]